MRSLALAVMCLIHWGVSTAAPEPVHESVLLDAKGPRIFLEVSGARDGAPLILFLHGGPGSVAHLVMFENTVGRRLEGDFRVAYLHQRGVGHSSSVPDSEQTIANNVKDVDRAVGYLLRRYGRRKINLVGHSWGGMLAASYAAAHAGKLEKLVLMNTALNFEQLLEDTQQGDLDWARRTGNEKAVAELMDLTRPFDKPEAFGVVLSWADRAGGTATGFDLDAYLASQHLHENFPRWRSQQEQVMGPLIPDMLKLDLSDPFDHLRLPVLFICGAMDTIVRPITMRRDFDNYPGPKAFVTLSNSHHLPFIDEPEALAKTLRTFLATTSSN